MYNAEMIFLKYELEVDIHRRINHQTLTYAQEILKKQERKAERQAFKSQWWFCPS
jgi:hypothetical protein